MTPNLIVLYEWSFESVEEQPATIASKMILFRGEKVFRVGLKNYAEDPLLFFMAIDLNKIGMKVRNVTYGMQGSGSSPAIMKQMGKDYMQGNNRSLQLFTTTLDEKVVGNCTVVFRICIEGTVSSYFGYSFQLSDRLAKDQLWATVKNQQNMPDVEFIVKDNKTFTAHKAILAARSRVFAVKFMKEQSVKDVPYQIWIDGVEPSTVENFLHFIYTGEPMGTLADEELLKLAKRYKLTTLTGLCQHALEKIDAIQMAKVRKRLNDNSEELSSSKILPEKETEIFFDRTTPTFRCFLRVTKQDITQPQCVMQYQNEDIFFAYLNAKTEKETLSKSFYISKPEIHLTCAKHRDVGLKVEDVYFGLQDALIDFIWLKLEPKNCQKNAELVHFAARSDWSIYLDSCEPVYFDIKVVSTIGNYYYEMMDDGWLTDFWVAATNQKLTDVDIFVRTVKVMEAHRIILCARSPVLKESLNKTRYTAGKPIVTFEPEFDVDTVKTFLNFLYTGSLKTSARSKQLHKLAKVYEVETLKNVCQLINANSSDVEELTNCLIQL